LVIWTNNKLKNLNIIGHGKKTQIPSIRHEKRHHYSSYRCGDRGGAITTDLTGSKGTGDVIPNTQASWSPLKTQQISLVILLACVIFNSYHPFVCEILIKSGWDANDVLQKNI
jgi:hypothetical protein